MALDLTLPIKLGAAQLAAVRGPSAYDLAVANGFEGTESEWLTSLGAAGPSDTGWRRLLAWDASGAFTVGDGFASDALAPTPGVAGYIDLRRHGFVACSARVAGSVTLTRDVDANEALALVDVPDVHLAAWGAGLAMRPTLAVESTTVIELTEPAESPWIHVGEWPRQPYPGVAVPDS